MLCSSQPKEPMSSPFHRGQQFNLYVLHAKGPTIDVENSSHIFSLFFSPLYTVETTSSLFFYRGEVRRPSVYLFFLIGMNASLYYACQMTPLTPMVKTNRISVTVFGT